MRKFQIYIQRGIVKDISSLLILGSVQYIAEHIDTKEAYESAMKEGERIFGHLDIMQLIVVHVEEKQ
jgi:hypothetical protein